MDHCDNPIYLLPRVLTNPDKFAAASTQARTRIWPLRATTARQDVTPTAASGTTAPITLSTTAAHTATMTPGADDPTLVSQRASDRTKQPGPARRPVRADSRETQSDRTRRLREPPPGHR